MNKTTIICEYEKYNLWEFPEKFNYTDDPARPIFEDSPDNKRAKAIIDYCQAMISLLHPIAEPSNIFIWIYNYLFISILGHLDYVYK